MKFLKTSMHDITKKIAAEERLYIKNLVGKSDCRKCGSIKVVMSQLFITTDPTLGVASGIEGANVWANDFSIVPRPLEIPWL